jgi:RNA polymerase sigma-70 factor (ECF subfamily)
MKANRTMSATDATLPLTDDSQVLDTIVRRPARNGAAQHAPIAQDTDELQLIERAVAGDERAFAELVTRYQTAVYNLAYRMLGDAGEAEDAAQEVFLRIYRRLATYNADHRFSTWVLSIASHYCIDLLRRKRPWLVPLENISNWMRARSRGPEAAALAVEQQDIVRNLLAKLPEHYRLVLLLRYWHDLGYEEIAQVVDLPVSTIKARLHRARNALAALVNGDGRLADALQASS